MNRLSCSGLGRLHAHVVACNYTRTQTQTHSCHTSLRYSQTNANTGSVRSRTPEPATPTVSVGTVYSWAMNSWYRSGNRFGWFVSRTTGKPNQATCIDKLRYTRAHGAWCDLTVQDVYRSSGWLRRLGVGPVLFVFVCAQNFFSEFQNLFMVNSTRTVLRKTKPHRAKCIESVVATPCPGDDIRIYAASVR